jgi:polygalacturonase
VLIEDCLFNTGDDCIAIKSGRNADGRKFNTPSENIIIKGCTMIDGHGGVAIGSEISGGVRNVFIEDCKMSSPNLDVALRIKSSAERGGTTENIYMRNVEVGQVAHQFVIVTMNYKNETGNFVPAMRNIAVKNVTVHNGGETGVFLDGYKDSPVENFRMSNVTIDSVKTPYKFVNAVNTHFDNVTINGKKVTL